MTVYLNDIDITEYVQGNSLTLTSAKSETGQLLINPIPSLVGIDTEGFWNPNNPVSPFFGINDYSVYEITVFDQGIQMFNGFVQNITRNNNGTASVNMQTELQQTLNRNLIYSSGGNKNPAEIFIEICQLYKISYDPVSTLKSSGIYDLNSVVVSSNVLTPNTTIISYLEVLAQIGVASIYSVNNYLCFQVYESGTIDYPVFTLENTSDSDAYYILSNPILSSIQKEVPDGYSVTYRDVTLSKQEDLTTTFGLQNNSFSLSGGQNDLITIESLQSATWIMEQWMGYLERIDTGVDIRILTKLANDLQVGYPLRLEMNDNTIDINFIINEIAKLNRVESQIRGIAYGN